MFRVSTGIPVQLPPLKSEVLPCCMPALLLGLQADTMHARSGSNSSNYSNASFTTGHGGSTTGPLLALSAAERAEALAAALEAARVELEQKNSLLAGLRGELRKFSGLTQRLEKQVG